MSSLIEMPELVMEKIIGFSEFRAVVTLRQVCRDFRNFIDDLNDSKLPNSKFEEITLRAGNKHVYKSDMFLIYGDYNNMHEVFYSPSKNDRKFDQNTTIRENADMDDVIRDLEWILKFQKCKVECFHFYFNDFQLQNEPSFPTLLDKLTKKFGGANRRIKATNFAVKTYDASLVLPMLQIADPDTLRKIFFLKMDYYKKLEIEADEVVKTVQWKKAEEIEGNIYLKNLNVKNICHFSRVEIELHSLNANDLNTLKKTFVSSSKCERWRIELKNFDEQELSNIWGPGFYFNHSSQWYFQTKKSEEKILRIEIFHSSVTRRENNLIIFDICEMTDVPDGAVIQNYNEK
ncbi:unnamed protein product [Caenorhabditis nigoni]